MSVELETGVKKVRIFRCPLLIASADCDGLSLLSNQLALVSNGSDSILLSNLSVFVLDSSNRVALSFPSAFVSYSSDRMLLLYNLLIFISNYSNRVSSLYSSLLCSDKVSYADIMRQQKGLLRAI